MATWELGTGNWELSRIAVISNSCGGGCASFAVDDDRVLAAAAAAVVVVLGYMVALRAC